MTEYFFVFWIIKKKINAVGKLYIINYKKVINRADFPFLIAF